MNQITLSETTSTSTKAKVSGLPSNVHWVRIFCRLLGVASDTTFDKYWAVTTTSVTKTISPLEPNTTYTINAAYETTVAHTNTGWIWEEGVSNSFTTRKATTTPDPGPVKPDPGPTYPVWPGDFRWSQKGIGSVGDPINVSASDWNTFKSRVFTAVQRINGTTYSSSDVVSEHEMKASDVRTVVTALQSVTGEAPSRAPNSDDIIYRSFFSTLENAYMSLKSEYHWK